MADLFKLLIVIIFINVGTSIIMAAVLPGTLLANLQATPFTQNLQTNSNDLANKYSNEELMMAQQGDTTQEDTGGVSRTITVWGVLMMIGRILFGGIFAIYDIVTQNTGGDALLQILVWGETLFLITLQLFVGLKTYSWLFNSDTR